MKGLPKNTIAWLLFCGSLAAPSAWGFETNYDRGRVDFAGRVTDISCSIALNGGQHAGSGNVWLAPVSLAEVHDRGAGAFMKPQPFTLALSNCQLRHDGGAASQDEVRRVSIDPSVMDDREMLEDLIAAALNDAVRRGEALSKEKMAGFTSGLNLPPGFKLPF